MELVIDTNIVFSTIVKNSVSRSESIFLGDLWDSQALDNSPSFAGLFDY